MYRFCMMFGVMVAMCAGARADLTAAQSVARYRLLPGDEIAVEIGHHPEVSAENVVVSSDGAIRLPLLHDALRVSGLSASELRASLTETYRKYLVGPSLTVTIAPRRADAVVLAGYAGTASMIYADGIRVVSLVLRNATLSAEADFSDVVVTHIDGTKDRLDLSKPRDRAGTPVDVLLRRGDVVYVPPLVARYRVVGEVAKPGEYPWREGMTVSAAIAEAGGVTDIAWLERAVLRHEGADEQLDLMAMLRLGDLQSNRSIAPGDILRVPENPDHAMVLGAVGRTGCFCFRSGDRITDALNFAIPVPSADLGHIWLVRRNHAANHAVIRELRHLIFLAFGANRDNIDLMSGDIVYVPERRRHLVLPDIVRALTSAGLIEQGTSVATTSPMAAATY